MEIYYFSGTGNSLFVARELQRRFPGSEIIPIAGMLNQATIKTKSDIVGLVFPVHALTIPIAVRKFIRKADFSSTDYIFAAATRMGSIFRGFELLDRLLRKKKKSLNAGFVFNMLNNDTRHGKYIVPAAEDISAVENAVLRELDTIAPIIRDKVMHKQEDSGELIGFGRHPVINRVLEKTVTSGLALSEYTGGVNYFYSDDKCIGCGICEKVCLSGKIMMKDQRPFWDKKTLCYMCFACLNFCPKSAVQIKSIPGVKSFSEENGRYQHPYATVGDMENQKHL